MKSRILEALRSSSGYVSGQELCERFGVTRTAIWKVMNQLKEDGYEIEAVSNKGYRIVGIPDSVSQIEISSILNTTWAGSQVVYLETVDSTNNYARKLAESGVPHGTLVVADAQDGGKGRRGKVWNTPARTSIAMTLIIRPELEPSNASMLTLVMGLAIAKAVRDMLSLEAMIKWPNDIVVHGKKICGILTEMSAEMEAVNYLVIGAGINVNLEIIPEEIKDIATSLSIESGHQIHRAQLIRCCLEYFEDCYAKFMKTQDFSLLIREYNDILINKDSSVKVMEPNNAYTGISRGINNRGELLVTEDSGEEKCVFAGEVSVRGCYGYV